MIGKLIRWVWLSFWGVVAALCTLVPLGAILWLEVRAAADLASGIKAVTFATTTGVITRSRILDADEGRVEFKYAYRVGGRELTGQRWSSGGTARTWPDIGAIVRQHPVGTPVTVYYNPANPHEALLRPGVDASDLLVMLVFVPFNIPVAFALILLYDALGQRIRSSKIAGIRVIHEGTRIYLVGSSPHAGVFPWELPVILLGATGVAFGLVFWFLVLDGSFPARLAAVGWNLLVGAGILFCRKLQVWAATALPVIDLSDGALELPRLPGEIGPTRIPLRDIERIYVVLFQEPYAEPTKGITLYASTYAPAIRYIDRDDQLAEYLLGQYHFRSDAEVVVECLHELLSYEVNVVRGELEYVGPEAA